MKALKEMLEVLKQNLVYTIALVIAIVLFAIFSNGLIEGLITAASVLVVYVCADKLYREYTKVNGKKSSKK